MVLPLLGLAAPSPAMVLRLFVLGKNEEIAEDLLILVEDDGGHFELALQGGNSLVEGLVQASHLQPVLDLFKELDQAA